MLRKQAACHSPHMIRQFLNVQEWLHLSSFRKVARSAGYYTPKTPSIQIVPTWGLEPINSTYCGLFGVLGYYSKF